MPLLGSFGAGSSRGFGLTAGGGGPPYTINFLVVAAGGGGGGTVGGGGGGGGFRTSTQADIKSQKVITATVGAGSTSKGTNSSVVSAGALEQVKLEVLVEVEVDHTKVNPLV
jgi:hypothetical protein